LVGIFGAGSDAGVIVSQDGKASRVRVGAQWSGWTLRSVDPARSAATFSARGRGTHEWQLKRQPQQGAMVYQPSAAPRSEESPAEPAESRAETEQAAAEAGERSPRRAASRNRSQREPNARARRSKTSGAIR